RALGYPPPMRFGSVVADSRLTSTGPLARGLSKIRVRWARFRAATELKALQSAHARALRAEADASRVRLSPPRPFLQ
ncbi:MAG TPA: hypothetical protein VM598_13860, partial [Bdellovibrionota bacterium]|nr:hypothetical protein [Bdellovibrionota bacterium]